LGAVALSPTAIVVAVPCMHSTLSWRELARRVVELATTTYAGFNQQHLTELLDRDPFAADVVPVSRSMGWLYPGQASIASSPRPASRRRVSGDRLGTDAVVTAIPKRACFFRSTPAGTTAWKGEDPI
jgi:hypothetical protein